MSQLNKIIDAVEHFCKLAGLLQVPEKALKELNDWLEACYCYEVAGELKKKIADNTSREKMYPELKNIQNEWSKILDAISQIKYSDGRKEGLDELIRQQPRLPNFNTEEKSSSGMTGVIKNGNSITIVIDKNTEEDEEAWIARGEMKPEQRGSYFYALDINYEGMETKNVHDEENYNYTSELVPIKIHKSEFHPIISINELIKLLSRDNNDISKIVYDFDSFINGYETYDDRYIRELQTVYGYCANKGKDIVEKEIRWKEIVISGIDLPYTKQHDTSVKIGVEYIRTKEEEKNINEKNDWAGLWSSSAFTYESNKIKYIGTIYVKSPNLLDKETPVNITELQQNIVGIQRTGRHELQHFVQSFLKYINKIEGGLPSKKIREKEVDYHGKPTTSTFPLEKEDEHGRIIHPLRDIEFYTRLSDSVHIFNAAKTYLPLGLHRDFMLNCIEKIGDEEFKKKALSYLEEFNKKNYKNYYWNRENDQFQMILYRMNRAGTYAIKEFFEALKNHQPLKYGKAVAVFTNAVGL